MSEFPYPGLRPFERDETDIFFGREEQIDQLLEKLGEARFLAIVGPSGCGKSSLVKAGLIAALETGFLASAGARWRIATMRPGAHPLTALSEALCSERALGPERGVSETAAAFLQADLRRGPLGLIEAVNDAGFAPGTHLLLLVDQFEEIFRYGGDGSDDEAEALVAILLATARDSKCPIYVVLTMRSDFLGDCTRFHGLPEAMNDSQFLTPRLNRGELRACIDGPAGVFGGSVEAALANRLLNDMGADPDQLPLMQHVLMRMWLRASGRTTSAMRRREPRSNESEVEPDARLRSSGGATLTIGDYEAVGTLSEALSNHAGAAFDSLDEEGQRIAEKMFRRLSERGSKRRDTRRPTRLREVAAVAEVEPDAVIEVVEVFRTPGRSFVTPPAGTPLDEDSILDISHESLIRQWDNMSGWVEAETRSGETYRRLEETARLWKRHLAAPWRRPDLDLALTWKVLEKPTLEWSRRYGEDYELAMEFLDESERQREQRQTRREKDQKRELEQARALAEAERKKADAERRLAQEQATVIQRLRRFSVALGLTALAAVIGVVLAMKLLSDIRARDRELTESRLSSRAILTIDTDPTQAVLLAAEARHDVDSAEESGQIVLHETTLLRVLSHIYNMEVPQGLRAGVRRLAFSPACDEGEWLGLVDRHGRAGVWSASDLGTAPRRSDLVVDLAFAPDCRAVAYLERHGDGAAGESARVLVRSTSEPLSEDLLELDTDGSAVRLAYSPDGRWLAASGTFGLELWDLQAADPSSGAERVEGVASRVVFAADSRQLAVAEGTTVTLWNLAGGMTRRAVLSHDRPVSDLAFSPMPATSGERWLATTSGSTAYLWDLTAMDPSSNRYVLSGHRALITAVVFSPDPEAPDYWLATASLDDSIRLWHMGYLDNPDPARTPKEVPHPAGVTTLAFRPPDGRWVATGGEDHMARVWDITTLATSDAVMLPHGDSVSLLAFSPDGSHLVTGSGSRPAKVWRLDQPTALPAITPFEGKISGLAFRPNQGSGPPWLAAASRYAIRLFEDLSSGSVGVDAIAAPEPPPPDKRSKFVRVGWSSEGTWLAAMAENNTVSLHAVVGDGLGESMPLEGSRSAMATSVDGAWLVTARPGESERGDEVLLSGWPDAGNHLDERSLELIWYVDSERAALSSQAKLVLPGGRISQIAIGGGDEASPRWLAASGLGGEVALWDLAKAELHPVLIELEDRVSALAFSPDGRWLVTGDWDDAAHVWDLEANVPRLHRRLIHNDAVRVVTFSPDGLWLATGSGDRQARLWSGSDFIELVSLAHRDAVISLAFGPKGEWFASGSLDNLLRVLPLERGHLHEAACRAAGRNLTREEWSEFLPGKKYHRTCDQYPEPIGRTPR